MFIQQVFGIWLFFNPLLGIGVMGLKAGAMTPVISLARHLCFGLVIAWLYPVTAERTAERSATVAGTMGPVP